MTAHMNRALKAMGIDLPSQPLPERAAAIRAAAVPVATTVPRDRLDLRKPGDEAFNMRWRSPSRGIRTSRSVSVG